MSDNPIHLDSFEYYQTLYKMADNGQLPLNLARLMVEVIHNDLRGEGHCITPPIATPEMIELARKHFPNGLALTNNGREKLRDIVVFVPDNHSADQNLFFRLIPKFPGGRFRYLREI